MRTIEKLSSEKCLIEESRKGIDKSVIIEILKQANLSLNELASYLHVSTRMIQKKANNDLFPPPVSEHALYIARLYLIGRRIFGSNKRFIGWMETENISLGGVKPKTYLDTYSGIQLLINKINGIAHGFPA